jgi:hypothetical protein
MAAGLTPTNHGQTTQSQKPGPIPDITTHVAAPQTGTRIQTHQNLFTLTKNILFLNIEAGNKHPASAPLLTFSGTTAAENRNSIFPINDLSDTARLATPTGGDGRNRTDDPLLAKQVLYQLSYIPALKSAKQEPSFCEQKEAKKLY